MRKLVTILAAILLAAMLPAHADTEQGEKLYGVIFDVTVDPAGKVETLTVSKVMDAHSGSSNPAVIVVPQAYIAAVKSYLLQRTYPAQPSHFRTYTFYDPTQPNRADINPNVVRP